ncbi:unnamed protein product [Cuscuta campestris]|uniref:Uncharacterized protein n=1 Tax=Cuscuta campestris TaxID=132261 RepID=A0A484LM99_9ASTE|nr:unnamed protein product [Cuscuta campestris]
MNSFPVKQIKRSKCSGNTYKTRSRQNRSFSQATMWNWPHVDRVRLLNANLYKYGGPKPSLVPLGRSNHTKRLNCINY